MTSQKSQVPWKEEEVKILQEIGENLSSIELAKRIKRHSPIAIAIKCRRMSIYKNKEFKSNQAKIARKCVINPYMLLDRDLEFEKFSWEVQQVILGSLLGDGYVTKNSNKSKEYCLREGHCKEQYNYLKWKVRFLDELKPKISNLEFFTPTHPIFTDLRNEFYLQNRRKSRMVNKYSEKIGWLGFFIWYLDDGGLQSRGRDYVITSKLFPKEEVISFVDILNKNLGLNLVIKFYRHNFGIMARVKVLLRDRDKVEQNFKKLFIEYNLPECMRYKVELKPLIIKRRNTHDKT